MKPKHLLELHFVEVTDIKEEAINEAGDVALNVRMKWQQGGVVNINKRRYRTELFQNEVERLSPMCEKGQVYGGAYHPAKGKDVEIPSAAVIWKKLWVEEDGSCVGDATILPTRVGKDAQVIIQAGGRIGVSSRGFGTITQKTEEIDGKMETFADVNDDFKLKTPGDLVLTPSVADTGPIQEQLEESFNTFYKSVSSKTYDLHDTTDEEKMKNKLKELKEKSPELVAELEKEFTANAEKANEKENWKQEVEKQVTEKIKPLQDEITTLKTEKNSVVESIKGVIETFGKSSETFKEGIDMLAKVPGVLPEKDGNEEEVETEAGTDVSKLEKKVDGLEKANKELTKKIEDKEQAEKDATADTELQGKLNVALEAELEKEDNLSYRKLIEKKLMTDGRILVEKVEDIEDAVKTAKQDVNDTLAEAKAAKIISADLNEIGKVEKPEDKQKLNEELLEAQFEEAVTSGYKGNLESYKKIILAEKE